MVTEELNCDQLKQLKRRPNKYAIPDTLYEIHNVRLSSTISGMFNGSVLQELELPLGDTVSTYVRVHCSQDEDSGFDYIDIYASGEMADILEKEIESNNNDATYTMVVQCKTAEEKKIEFSSDGDFVSTTLIIAFILKEMVPSHT